jgi:beta-galactosidase/beta-glucuronidase
VTYTNHPTPLLERDNWRSLDGTWAFAFDHEGRWEHPDDVRFDRDILVPYPPESASSGIGDTGPHPVVWYARALDLSEGERPSESQRLLLHFGAVDYRAQVWVDGTFVKEHAGGNTPFAIDITRATRDKESVDIVVRAEDDPTDLAQPRGKQDWQDEPHVIWHYRTTGIWQTVWIEIVPDTYIADLGWTADLSRWALDLDVTLHGQIPPNLRVEVELSSAGDVIASETWAVTSRDGKHVIRLEDPGIDDRRLDLQWSPEHPRLLEATLTLWRGTDLLDRVQSYTAMRSVGTDDGHFLLNGRPYYLRLALDQGYRPDSLLAATNEELKTDVELAKRLGFNGVRMHQKVAPPQWLYWCDILGLLAWGEMPSHYAFSTKAVARLTAEWTEVIRRDRSHPCIVAWVPFNESWGLPDLPNRPDQQAYLSAIYYLTRALDPTRPVVANDGWEHLVTDVVGIHDYSLGPERILEQYGTRDLTAAALLTHRPGGRQFVLNDFRDCGQPVMLTEFGAFDFDPDSEAAPALGRVQSPEQLLNAYSDLLEAVHSCQGLAGFCYTQFTDTFYEMNGLLTAERRPKADLEQLARATKGNPSGREAELQSWHDPMGYSKRWRARLEKEARVGEK